ncbi:phosphate ABC transporter permease subunit PstC [Salinarchaeum sp. IM2453]|uniref:phosphate ABC transporter permease subunit PstC n=1 Tax=Salinarchaeum sp. IM2453 TaxID=2862870 RepID=UPI001C828ED8|nr:phosphate ABC transporter permease subunit PstC [Salinarchaeum sp. IM2453]QZA89375.1 phosphate ABC transporter permease subunit PstC [Salinarchaeum sp. IM2453]
MSEQNQLEVQATETAVKSAKRTSQIIRWALFGCMLITVLTTLAIFGLLINESAHFFFNRSLVGIITAVFTGGEIIQRVSFVEFFTDTEWRPSHAVDPRFGLLPLAAGTLLVTFGAAMVSIPIGTLTALYVSEYASARTKAYLKPTLEILAGIPTIVYGFFAISFVTPVVIRPLADILGYEAGIVNAASASIVVGIMTIPMVASISEDAMDAVPDSLRDGAYALGATKYQVSTRIVLPASISGIFASYILAISRAIGETMAVTLAAGRNPQITLNFFDEIQTITAYMVNAARGTAVVGSVEYQSLFAAGLILFLITLAMNTLNDYMKHRFREVYK